ncbi:SseB protein N-terminal domain-containing protein [Amycolatopsis marina]|uniref:SseB protein N-terminal domain-containing protein n=1 Tax=Amycolatopsis marina TaxID=490629 RepID=A0A1I1AWB2_9PSEU|nr:SseB family protein [Amycolatopsis marina]SFB40620.1 SseB protein N-terminal domain-containing protein [Amycolatopsis marina]
MEFNWEPANEAERSVVAALERGAGQEVARLLMSEPLYVPDMRDGDAENGWLLRQRLPLPEQHVLVFTSPETLSWVLGDLVSRHWKTSFGELREQWPGTDWQLAVNPGTPFAVFLPIDGVPKLAEGEETLLPLEEMRQRTTEQALIHMRQACRTELAGTSAGDRNSSAAHTLDDHEPANELESQLHAATAQRDGDKYLESLVDGSVIVPTTEPVPDPAQAPDALIPWRIILEDSIPTIPVFSSNTGLDRLAPPESSRIQISFRELLANWPSEEQALCVNPGMSTELFLPGDAVLGLAFTILEAGESLAGEHQPEARP